MDKVIALDFDGVIANSAYECFVVSYLAYKGLEPTGPEVFNVDNKPVKALFMKFRYLVGPADEYYYLMKTIEDSMDSNNDFLTRYEKNKHLYQQEAQEFSEEFYRLRKHIRNRFSEQWLKFNPIYPGIANVIKKVLSRGRLFIASTKDEESIDLILKKNGFSISFENILGKSFSLDKKVQIKEIIHRTNQEAENVYFVDDNSAYLIQVKPLGVSCFLARWGYNIAETRKNAEELGIKSVTIQDLEEIVA